MKANKQEKIAIVLSIFYVIVTYGCLIFFKNHIKGNTYYLLLPAALFVINAIYLKINYDHISRDILLDCSLIIKYLLIPIYIIGGLIVLIVFLMMFNPMIIMMVVSPLIISTLCFHGWLYMFGGSVFSIAYIHKASKEQVHNKLITMIAYVCQVFFTVDVISMMVLTFKEKKHIKITIAMVVILAAGCIGSIVWFISHL